MKAVDAQTGKLVGYARWKLHENHYCKAATAADDGSSSSSLLWPEGRVPDVSADEAARIEDAWVSTKTEWKPLEFTGKDDLDANFQPVKRELLAKKEYMRKSSLPSPHHQKRQCNLLKIAAGLPSKGKK